MKSHGISVFLFRGKLQLQCMYNYHINYIMQSLAGLRFIMLNLLLNYLLTMHISMVKRIIKRSSNTEIN